MSHLKFALRVIVLLIYSNVLYGQQKMNTTTLLLNDNWEFSFAGSEAWKEAKVPGTIHQDLLRYNLIPEPFYGENEKKVQWVEEKDWEYRTEFLLTKTQLTYDAIDLNFLGLDTYADVYLNGGLLLKNDNMFVGRSIPVKSFLREGVNKLYLYFHSPITNIMPQYNSNGFNYPAGNDHHEKHLSVFTRKAPCSYGWDWGIRLVTSGIWRDVSLSFYNYAKIEDYSIVQQKLTDDEVITEHNITLFNPTQDNLEVNIALDAQLKGVTKAKLMSNKILFPGLNTFTLPLKIESPKRWMPNGWGDATLYNFNLTLSVNDQIVATKSQKYGFRTLQVVNEKDSIGESFYFVVNGEPMFAKGANYIPQDALLPRVTHERYEKLFKAVKEANMNMIRVWGGGIYEDDYFYQLADENGILIWQDFMFACTPYPSDPTFLKRVEAEAKYNIKRLRNHPSLAMWCGNNEVYEALQHYGFQKQFSPVIYKEFCQGYDKVFKELLPQCVAELDPQRFYLHSSPYFSNWGDAASWKIGDSHNWGVWHGRKPFSTFEDDIPRFMSEFGFQSFPEMKTIRTFADSTQYSIDSPVMKGHQKSGTGNELIHVYMERDYKVPESFEDFVYVNLVLQGEGMRKGLEAHRRHKPYCMGTLYWQLNDCWPVVSWSSIDYYGNYKALHYQAKRAFQPLLISPTIKHDALQVYLVSDQLKAYTDLKLVLQLKDFYGKVIETSESTSLSLAANSAEVVLNKKLKTLFPHLDKSQHYLELKLETAQGEELSRTHFFFASTKDLLLPQPTINCHVEEREGVLELTLSSQELVKDLFIEIPVQSAHFSDNFFDLLPNEERHIVITSSQLTPNIKENIKLNHIRQTY